MIIKEGKNIPVASAQIENMTAALTLFRTFKNENAYQMAHLITFLSVPSYDRDEFYSCGSSSF